MRFPESSAEEPGIYYEPGAGNTTLVTIHDNAGRPILHAMIANEIAHGAVPQELRDLYHRCVQRRRLGLV